MQFGDRIKELRKAKGYSQRELGDILELGQTTIANYEKNIRFPSPDVLIRIANIFDESIDNLVGRKDDSKLKAFNKEEIKELLQKILDLLLDEKEQELIVFIGKLDVNQERIIQLYEEVYKPVLDIIGEKWQAGEINVAKEHYVSAIVYKLITQNFLDTTSSFGASPSRGNVICMSLSGEPHTLGVRMISDYFVMLGFKSYYIGSNVPTDALIALINTTKPSILAISATMPYHIDNLANLIQVIRHTPQINKEISANLTIVVGGQAFKIKEEALLTGADYYANSYEVLEEIFGHKRVE